MCMKNNKSSVRLDGPLASYMQWPIYLAVVLICFDICVGIFFPAVIPFVLIYTVIYLIISILIWCFKRQAALKELTSFATEFNHAQHMMLKELDVPFGMLDLSGHLVWANNDLKDLITIERCVKEPISKIFNNDSLNVLPTVEEDVEYHITYGRNSYLMRLRLVTPSEYGDTVLWHAEKTVDAPDDSLIAMFLYDETENIALKKENFDEKMIVGLLYIDNFDEAFEGADEVRRSLVTAWVEREINKYMKPYDAIIKHLEKDRYMFVIKQRYLAQIEADRFSILEDIRNLKIYDLTMTISIGVGVYTDSYMKAYEGAHEAIDLALGRGGDQAVVKRPTGFSYFGGTTASPEKSTRVKARVKAHALREYIEAKDKVVVMGHNMADIDAVGASIGIYRIAKTLNKRCYISLTDPTNVIQVVVDGFKNDPEYEEDMFISGTKAKSIVDNDTLLVVVDVNRPSYTDTPDLLRQTGAVVVLDHHRQMSDKIDNAVLSYIEPYASSTCEMIAEVLQYISDDLKLRSIEADAMYGGIMIDTNNFLVKTGVRTFEAAAYLRRNGADVTKIRKTFRTSFNEYRAKANAVSSAEVFMQNYVFAVSESAGLDNPTVVAAQAANELLNIEGVKGSFVFTEYNGKVFISARSIDELNVQIIMEKIGGGGHMSAAGAQFENVSVIEAMNKVKKTIIEMTENKEIK